jgi:hypothetical protein
MQKFFLGMQNLFSGMQFLFSHMQKLVEKTLKFLKKFQNESLNFCLGTYIEDFNLDPWPKRESKRNFEKFKSKRRTVMNFYIDKNSYFVKNSSKKKLIFRP